MLTANPTNSLNRPQNSQIDLIDTVTVPDFSDEDLTTINDTTLSTNSGLSNDELEFIFVSYLASKS